ncbi:unnamed protein product, partial [Laminaria digitata]
VREKHDAYARDIGNPRRRFHGTSCSDECNFFFNLERGPCGSRDCSVCSIRTRGFLLKENVGRTAVASNSRLRYGEGMYFSSVSGKANDYAAGSEKVDNDMKWRCMFIATAAVGRAHRTQEAVLPAHMCPPPGFDAVLGEV